MKIAVVGSGISGLGAALALSEKHEVSLFEKNSYFGGHSNTVKIELKEDCLLYTSPSPRDRQKSRMPSSA